MNPIVKTKLLNAAVLLSSLFAYLEWGHDMHTFLYQAELDIFVKGFKDPMSVVHPFTLIPLFGQILLFITLFQKNPSRLLSLIGIFSLSILLLLIFFIGLMGLNYKIIGCSIPFIFFGTLSLIHLFRHK